MHTCCAVAMLLLSTNTRMLPEPARHGATLAPKPPRGAVIVPAADGALAAAVAGHGDGATFYLRSGVHKGNGEIRPRQGSVFIGGKLREAYSWHS